MCFPELDLIALWSVALQERRIQKTNKIWLKGGEIYIKTKWACFFMIHIYRNAKKKIGHDNKTGSTTGTTTTGNNVAGKVADMLSQQPNVGTFWHHPPVVATKNWSRHTFFVSVFADIHQIFL